MDSNVLYILFVFCQFIDKAYLYENLAFNKTVRVSKRYNNDYFAPSKVVDGNWSISLLQCALTASGQKEAWLTIDLGERKNVASITMIHGTLGFGSSSISSSVSGLSADADGDGPVYTSKPRRRICKDSFDENNAQVVCLAWGFLPDNPSYTFYGNGSFAQYYDNVLNCEGNEVNINTCPKGIKGCPSKESVAVKCKKGNTLSGFSVYVSNTDDWKSGFLCYQHDIQQMPRIKIIIDCVTSGRYVTFYNTRKSKSFSGVSEYSYINACEIIVNGCDLGFYGVNCTQCPRNCFNNSCHFKTGECVNCIAGYIGASCETACSPGRYGHGCAFVCGNCLDNSECNNVNGVCVGDCSPGWKGDKCDQVCENGYFGLNCELSCNIPNCRNSTSCDVITGECLEGCIEGLAGKTCNECEGNFYGERCNMTCSEFCKDGVCIRTTGQCRDCIHGRSGFFCETKVTENNPSADSNISITVIAVVTLFVFITLMIMALLICVLKRKCKSSHSNNKEQNYETIMRTKDSNEYSQIQHDIPNDNTAIETTHYMEINSTDITGRTEYINFGFKP